MAANINGQKGSIIDYSWYVEKSEDDFENVKYPDYIPNKDALAKEFLETYGQAECFKTRLEQIQSFMNEQSPENIGFTLAQIYNNTRIYEQTSGSTSTGSIKRICSQQYVKASPAYIKSLLKDTRTYSQWMVFLSQAKLNQNISDSLDLIELEANITVYSLIPIRTSFQMLRSEILNNNNVYILGFQLSRSSSASQRSDIKDLLMFVTIQEQEQESKVLCKTYIETTALPGRINSQIAYQLGLNLIKSISDFKYYAATQEAIQKSDIQFKITNYEEVQKQYSIQQEQKEKETLRVVSNFQDPSQSRLENVQTKGKQISDKNKNQQNQEFETFSPSKNIGGEIEDLFEREDKGQALTMFDLGQDQSSNNGNEVEPELTSEECKDADGKWTKWIMARCTPEHKDLYYRTKEKLEAEGYSTGFSENMILRYTFAYKEDAAMRLKQVQDWRIENNAICVTPSMIQSELSMRGGFVFGHDRDGRAVLYLLARKYVPSMTDVVRVQSYMTYMLDKAMNSYIASQKPNHLFSSKRNVDSYVLIYDFNGMGRNNFDLSQIKSMAPIMSNNYAEGLYRMYLLNTGFAFSLVFKLIKPFIAEVTKLKFKMPGTNYLQELQEILDLDQIPSNYGGTGPSLEELPEQ